jgi:hypothetical protein
MHAGKDLGRGRSRSAERSRQYRQTEANRQAKKTG